MYKSILLTFYTLSKLFTRVLRWASIFRLPIVSFEHWKGYRIYSIVALICRIDSSAYNESILFHRQELFQWLYQEGVYTSNIAYQQRIEQSLVRQVICVETFLMVKCSSLSDWTDSLSLLALFKRLYIREISSGSNGILVVRLPYVHFWLKIYRCGSWFLSSSTLFLFSAMRSPICLNLSWCSFLSLYGSVPSFITWVSNSTSISDSSYDSLKNAIFYTLWSSCSNPLHVNFALAIMTASSLSGLFTMLILSAIGISASSSTCLLNRFTSRSTSES